MAEASTLVERECRTLTRYLSGTPASDYVLLCYARGLQSSAFNEAVSATPLDALLDRMARRGVFAASLADTYARFCAPAGRLRRKLVLLLAILESAPTAQAYFEPPRHGRVRTFVELTLAAARFALLLPAALLLIAPLHAGVAWRSAAGPRSS